MSIQLFEHNKQAYDAVAVMLNEKGKAAVIHPTGTGKSFIGFKYCEDNPDKTICWLSPSEYIFKTQLENLSAVNNGVVPQNIVFRTYARLMTMDEDEMRSLKIDALICDEYHRLGAEIWSLYFYKLRNIYADVPMLGLSATNIRYLDNQRDMAEELFDGNIASSMTLGEAIVRGILNPPKYVLSIYSYQEELEKLEWRVQITRNKAAKHEAEQYLEALRRALEKAEGLDVLFQKNMDDHCGKYIVFCANYEHMQDVIGAKIHDWFHLVNENVKIYTLYSGEVGADRSFREFKEDNDTSALRLLFCIDALNEGVHVEDISGVILLRPTVSPIIYKQQIGRALSASKNTTPVIFDIVNNIENLYSIDSVKEEMQTAIQYFIRSGEGGMVVNETFEIVDKVVECRELFRKLEGTLSEGWNLMFERARDFYLANGNLEVPKNDKYIGLYSWLTTQRSVYNGKTRGNLTQAQIMKLNSIGMRWESKTDYYNKQCLEACRKYRQEHGDLLVPASYRDGDVNLGSFISNLRTKKRNGSEIPSELLAELEKLGMVWDVSEYTFQKNYALLVKYKEQYGDLMLPINYVDPDTGVRLGAYCSAIRFGTSYFLTDEQHEMLDKLGFVWNGNMQKRWDAMFENVKNYFTENGSLEVISSTSKEGKWLSHQRDAYRAGKLSAEKIELLNSVGMIWEIPDSWEIRFQLVKKFYEENGHIMIPFDLVVDGIWLNKWLNEQKLIGEGKRKKQITEEQREKLISVGLQFGRTHGDYKWEQNYEDAKLFFAENGHLRLPFGYASKHCKRLDAWVIKQRKAYRDGTLDDRQIKLLQDIGMIFEIDDPWQIGFDHAKAYFKEHGDLLVPDDYICDDSFKLGKFICNQRSKYKTGKMDIKKIQNLESIGMIWDVLQYLWDMMYTDAKVFYEANGHLNVPVDMRSSLDTNLYEWLLLQRKQWRKGVLSEYAIQKLNEIGYDWLSPNERAWENNFTLVKAYYDMHGVVDFKFGYCTESGVKLGRWLNRQQKNKAKLSTEQIEKLGSVGVVLDS